MSGTWLTSAVPFVFDIAGWQRVAPSAPRPRARILRLDGVFI
jgi:hypothetical protein